MTKKVWGGDSVRNPMRLVNLFNASISFDRQLYAYDIEGVSPTAACWQNRVLFRMRMLRPCWWRLGKSNGSWITGGLSENNDYEDIHTLVEKSLVEKVGSLGEKIHTGRSRKRSGGLGTRGCM